MDPLSDVLSLLKVRGVMARGFDAAGEWSIKFGSHQGIKFYAIVSGECWLSVHGVAEPTRIRAGDCFLLPSGLPFRLASDLALEPTTLPAQPGGGVTSYNGGGEVFAVGGYFKLSGDYAAILLGALPPVIHIREESGKALLLWCLDQLGQELRDPQPGGFAIAQQLATIVLVQVLRLHLSEHLGSSVGWLFALADKQIGSALNALHDNPGYNWTLRAMAERAGLSRTVFTLKFKEKVGVSPMEYLTRWRMAVAADRLQNSTEPVSAIALSLGYVSGSAFSAAFKRTMGCSPRSYTSNRTHTHLG